GAVARGGVVELGALAQRVRALEHGDEHLADAFWTRAHRVQLGNVAVDHRSQANEVSFVTDDVEQLEASKQTSQRAVSLAALPARLDGDGDELWRLHTCCRRITTEAEAHEAVRRTAPLLSKGREHEPRGFQSVEVVRPILEGRLKAARRDVVEIADVLHAHAAPLEDGVRHPSVLRHPVAIVARPQWRQHRGGEGDESEARKHGNREPFADAPAKRSALAHTHAEGTCGQSWR